VHDSLLPKKALTKFVKKLGKKRKFVTFGNRFQYLFLLVFYRAVYAIYCNVFGALYTLGKKTNKNLND